VKLQARDGDDRRAVELGIVKAIQEMNAARTGSGEAAAKPAGIFGVGAGHKSRRLLMPHLDEADGIGTFPQGLHDAVDPIAGDSKNCIDTPRG
jgi:hypothetical protein